MAVVGVCAPVGCVNSEGVSGAVNDNETAGVINGSGVMLGVLVLMVVIVECSPCASNIVRPNCAFITSLEPETEMVSPL